jgi:hypothetical protein
VPTPARFCEIDAVVVQLHDYSGRISLPGPCCSDAIALNDAININFCMEYNMVHTVHDPVASRPLDSFSSPVERGISIRLGPITAAADVRANWSRLEVRVVEPKHLAGITFIRDRSGYAMALHAVRDPSSRFAYGRRLTARAIDLVQRLLAKTIADHEKVASHADQIADRCLCTQRRLDWLDARQSGITGPARRSALKRCLKRGKLGDREYQSILRRLRDLELQSTHEISQVRREALADVAEGISSSPIPFSHALVHLSDAKLRQTG